MIHIMSWCPLLLQGRAHTGTVEF